MRAEIAEPLVLQAPASFRRRLESPEDRQMNEIVITKIPKARELPGPKHSTGCQGTPSASPLCEPTAAIFAGPYGGYVLEVVCRVQQCGASDRR